LVEAADDQAVEQHVRRAARKRLAVLGTDKLKEPGQLLSRQILGEEDVIRLQLGGLHAYLRHSVRHEAEVQSLRGGLQTFQRQRAVAAGQLDAEAGILAKFLHQTPDGRILV